MFAAGVAAAATGPGSGATPGIAGGVSGVGVATGRRSQEQRPCQPRARDASFPSSEAVLWLRVLMAFLAFGSKG